MKNQPTINVIRTAIRSNAVPPNKLFQSQSKKNSTKALAIIKIEKAQTNRLNHLRGILTNDT